MPILFPLGGRGPGVCLALLLVTLLVPAWSSADEGAKVEVTSDTPYKAGERLSEYETARCKLDIYAPAAGANLPGLVWFHGGGLTGGDKAGVRTVEVCRALANEGMVVMSVNYRLSPKVKYPAYLEDGAAAIAWCHAHAAALRVDPARLFVGGHSAGGYLTALLALDDHYLQSCGLSSGDLAGFIPLSGQMMTHFTIREERGLPKSRLIVDEAAPIYHARKDTPPWLILYAEHDMSLRGDENRFFAAALQAAGNRKVTLREIAGVDHVGIGDRISEPENAVRAAIVEFMQVKGEPGAQ